MSNCDNPDHHEWWNCKIPLPRLDMRDLFRRGKFSILSCYTYKLVENLEKPIEKRT